MEEKNKISSAADEKNTAEKESATKTPQPENAFASAFYTLGSIAVLIASAWLFQKGKQFRKGGF